MTSFLPSIPRCCCSFFSPLSLCALVALSFSHTFTPFDCCPSLLILSFFSSLPLFLSFFNLPFLASFFFFLHFSLCSSCFLAVSVPYFLLSVSSIFSSFSPLFCPFFPFHPSFSILSYILCRFLFPSFLSWPFCFSSLVFFNFLSLYPSFCVYFFFSFLSIFVFLTLSFFLYSFMSVASHSSCFPPVRSSLPSLSSFSPPLPSFPSCRMPGSRCPPQAA